MNTVVVTEGEPNIRSFISRKLQQGGYGVLPAESGISGLEKVREYNPNLILLSLFLGDMGATTFCQLIRKDPLLSHIPIVVTAKPGMNEEIQQALDQGADSYVLLGQPFPSGLLLSLVNAILRRAAGEERGVNVGEIRSGNLVIELVARRACMNNKELRLSQREFDLLVELIRYRGVVLSRELILSRVWGVHKPLDTRTVDVHIRWLREKIEADPANPIRIVTVRGHGYRFNDAEL